jgi:putative transposase
MMGINWSWIPGRSIRLWFECCANPASQMIWQEKKCNPGNCLNDAVRISHDFPAGCVCAQRLRFVTAQCFVYAQGDGALVCPAFFVPVRVIETEYKEHDMARGKKHTAEQVVNLLRQIEVAVANGKTTGQACKEALITEQTYYRWRKEYGGLQVVQAKRLKELEQENAKLKRLVANLSLDNLVLKDFASGNF